jgi:hypothetical protein
MVRETALTYNISPNGWPATGTGKSPSTDIIARGLAPTMEQARADAVTAAAHRPSAEGLLEDALESLPLEAA